MSGRGHQNGSALQNGQQHSNGYHSKIGKGKKRGKTEMVVIIMKSDASVSHTSAVIQRVERLGLKVHLSEGDERTIVGLIGDTRILDQEAIERMPGVERVVPVLKP